MSQMLAARERRAGRQQELLRTYGRTVISFCLNIAGPVKNGPLCRRTFHEGLSRLQDALQSRRMGLIYREQTDEATGCEALLVVEGDGQAVKALCVAQEDADGLARLFDFDVLTPTDRWDRERLGLPARPCLVCGRRGKDCAARRVHSVQALQQATYRVMRDFFARKDADFLAGQAARALLYEVSATPKPGLVDRANSGSHRDMDLFTFLDSTAALLPYLRKAVRIGQQTAERPPQETFLRLRQAGLAAEREMYRATGGVNTHKGAIFSLGTVCAAAGRLWEPERRQAGVEAVLSECGRMCEDAVAEDFAAMRQEPPKTAGQRLYANSGLRGIRGELARGLPSVRQIGLPALRRALAAGASLEEAGCTALVRMIARVADTNLFARGGTDGQQWAAQAAAALEGSIVDSALLAQFDREMIRRNLSPGGCADLLAVTYFLHFYATACDTIFQ